MPLSIDPESGGYFQDDYRGEIDSAAGEDGDAMSDREQLIAQRARALALEEAATFVATHVAIEPSVSGTTEPTFQGYLMREIVLVPGNHHIGLAYAAALQARAAAPAPGESNGV